MPSLLSSTQASPENVATAQPAPPQPPASQPPASQPPATQPPASAEQAAESQAATQQPPATEPVSGTPVAVSVPGIGVVVPMTRNELSALSRRQDQLTSQMRSAEGRRDKLVKELENTSSPAVRAGLEERLRFLDDRLLSIEKDVAENSALRASLAATMPRESSQEGTTAPSSRNPDNGPPGGIIALLVLLPISVAIARSIWRRSSRRTVQAALPQAEARFAQLEQAIDTVAVEIERVAEGQRFVTRLLREGQPVPDFSVRGAEGVAVRPGAESGN